MKGSMFLYWSLLESRGSASYAMRTCYLSWSLCPCFVFEWCMEHSDEWMHGCWELYLSTGLYQVA